MITTPWPDLLICDLDGTLVDSIEGIARTTRATLLAAGLRLPAESEVWPLIGLPLVDVFKTLTPVTTTVEEIARLVATYRDIYARLAIPTTRAFPGVAETLVRYREAGGRVAIATSKLAGIATAALEAAHLLPLVDVVMGHDSVANPKPAPDMVFRCLEATSVTGDHALVVGDTTFDLEMAAAAGVRACAVTTGVHSREQLLTARPLAVVDSFGDVLTVWFSR